jgi:hypothetical protein
MNPPICMSYRESWLCHPQCCFQVCVVTFYGSISNLAHIWEISIPHRPHFTFWHPLWYHIQPKCLSIWNVVHKLQQLFLCELQSILLIGLNYIMHDTLHILQNLCPDYHNPYFNAHLLMPSLSYMPKAQIFFCV